MHPNLICNDLNGIDFNNPADLRRILHQDKHTRIEGLCSEAVFMEDVVQGNLDPVTSDFWFSRTRDGYHIRKVVTDITVPLNDLDYRILDGMATGCPVSIAYFAADARTFNEFRHVKGQRYNRLDGLGTPLARTAIPVIADKNERDPERIDKAGSYLEQRGLLKDAAIKRLFANCWLGGYAWDIDAFTVTSGGQVVALEVKQKYATNGNSFGINNGQRNLLVFLIGMGIPVIHVILEKPEKDPKLHAIDLLTLPEYTRNTRWRFTRFFPQKLKEAIQKAPRYTSIFGGTGLAYSHIPENQFEVLKNLGVPADDIRQRLLAGLE